MVETRRRTKKQETPEKKSNPKKQPVAEDEESEDVHPDEYHIQSATFKICLKLVVPFAIISFAVLPYL